MDFIKILLITSLFSLVGCKELQQLLGQEPPKVEQNPASVLASIDQRRVLGVVRNQSFAVQKSTLENGILELRQGKDFFADVSVKVFTFADDDLSGKSFTTYGQTQGLKPHIHLSIKPAGTEVPTTEIIMDNYDLMLKFGDKEALGIPYVIKLTSLTQNTNIEGKYFAAFNDVAIATNTEGEKQLNLNEDSLDLLKILATQYIAEQDATFDLGESFAVSYTGFGEDYPKSGFVGFESVKQAGVETQLKKIQLIKDKDGWRVLQQLKANQIDQAHAVIAEVTGNLRTVEGHKAKQVVGVKLEQFLNQENIMKNVRSTGVSCYLTKDASKASCRAVYGVVDMPDESDKPKDLNSKVGELVKSDNKVDAMMGLLTQATCHNKNYLLVNGDSGWQIESEILDTQKVNYKSGELEEHKPFSMHCG